MGRYSDNQGTTKTPPSTLAIDPPVDVFSSRDEVLAWQRALGSIREQHAHEYRTVIHIAREEGYTDHLLDLITARSRS